MNQLLMQTPVLLAPGGGPTLSFMGVNIAYKVTSRETQGTLAVLEYHMPPNFAGPAPHWHKLTNEGFYVLEGRINFELDGQVFPAEPGAFVYVPTRTVHKFSNAQNSPARMLELINPGGFEDYFKELMALAQTESEWPPKDMQKVLDLYKKYDTFMPEEL